MSRQTVNFGAIVISWELPEGIESPLALDITALNGKTLLVTLCEITLDYTGTGYGIRVQKGYRFDGASIPRLFWAIPGFSPFGKHVWAALFHDWLCDHPQIFPRRLADAVFGELISITGVGWRGTVMDYAVTLYGIWRKLSGAKK